jgi:hypothetical protein
MKYVILAILLASVLFIGQPKKAICDNCSEYIGKSCYSKYECNPSMCDLVCASSNKYDPLGYSGKQCLPK